MEYVTGLDSNISPALKKVFSIFLNELERSRRATDVAVAALAEAGVIQPWQIKLKAAPGERAIAGLYRIDEVGINALADDVFAHSDDITKGLPSKDNYVGGIYSEHCIEHISFDVRIPTIASRNFRSFQVSKNPTFVAKNLRFAV